jgi:hypothetical protein
METEIDINTRIEEEKKEAQRIIRDSTKSDVELRGGKKLGKKIEGTLYDVVLTKLSDDTRNTLDQIGYMDSYETAVAVFRAGALALRERIDVLTLEERLSSMKSNGNLPDRTQNVQVQEISKKEKEIQDEITDAVLFSNKYALYFAGQVGLALLGSEKTKTELRVGFEPSEYASDDRDLLTKRLAVRTGRNLSTVLEEKGSESSDDDLKSTLADTFTTWINQFNWDRFSSTAEKYGIDKTKIKHRNFSIEAGKFKRVYSDVKVNDFMDVRKEDIIGEQEFHRVIWNNLVRLLAYDHEKRKNPFKPAKVIFATGDPGCGKTFGAHAMMRSAGDLASELGISFWAFPFSITDFGTEYKDKAALAVADICRQIIEFPGPVGEYVSDADTLLNSRKDSRATPEDKKVMSVIFGKYDGTRIPKNGKFLSIMDANYIGDIDDATKSRIFDAIVRLERFKTPEEFGEYARRYLTRDAPISGVNANEWNEIGRNLIEGPLSNREIEHVLSGLTRGYEIPIDILRKSYDEKVAYRNQHFEGITKGKVIEAFDLYIQTRMEIERASQEAMTGDNVERFLSSLKQPGPDSGIQVRGR